MDSGIDPFTPAVALAAAIRWREVNPIEVTEANLEWLDQLEPVLNAFCHRGDDEVRLAAKEAADAVIAAPAPNELPSFHGVPLPINDLVNVAGWPTTYGSAGAHQAPARQSDPIVRRFVDAGFLLFGQTATPFKWTYAADPLVA